MIKKILVPLDGSKLAEKSLPYAEELAYRFDAQMILIRVDEPALIISDHGVPAYKSDNGQPHNEASLYLNSLKGELREHKIPAQTIIAENHGVAETIIEKACEKDVDLIVMSTHGRSGIGRWVYGSIATKVLQQAPCPVFLVRAKETVS